MSNILLTKILKITSVIAVTTLSFSIIPNGAWAQAVSPFQTGHYMTAFSNVRDMAHPPSGLFVLRYNYYATTNKYCDSNGNQLSTLKLSEINPDLPDVDLDIDLTGFATAPALFWAANKTILGGARYMVGVTPVYFSSDVSFITEARGGANDTMYREEYSGRISGFSDTYFAPLGLSWGFNHFDLTLFYGFTAPTVRYETGVEDNIGLGFWTHQVQGFGYYCPVEDQSTALMLGLTYEMTSDVKGEDFNPGNRLSLEWGSSQYVSDRVELAVQGGHNWQVSDDEGEDVFAKDWGVLFDAFIDMHQNFAQLCDEKEWKTVGKKLSQI